MPIGSHGDGLKHASAFWEGERNLPFSCEIREDDKRATAFLADEEDLPLFCPSKYFGNPALNRLKKGSAFLEATNHAQNLPGGPKVPSFEEKPALLGVSKEQNVSFGHQGAGKHALLQVLKRWPGEGPGLSVERVLEETFKGGEDVLRSVVEEEEVFCLSQRNRQNGQDSPNGKVEESCDCTFFPAPRLLPWVFHPQDSIIEAGEKGNGELLSYHSFSRG